VILELTQVASVVRMVSSVREATAEHQPDDFESGTRAVPYTRLGVDTECWADGSKGGLKTMQKAITQFVRWILSLVIDDDDAVREPLHKIPGAGETHRQGA